MAETDDPFCHASLKYPSLGFKRYSTGEEEEERKKKVDCYPAACKDSFYGNQVMSGHVNTFCIDLVSPNNLVTRPHVSAQGNLVAVRRACVYGRCEGGWQVNALCGGDCLLMLGAVHIEGRKKISTLVKE